MLVLYQTVLVIYSRLSFNLLLIKVALMHIVSPQRLFVCFSLAKPQIKQTSLTQLELARALNTKARPVNQHNLRMTLGFLEKVDPTSYLT